MRSDKFGLLVCLPTALLHEKVDSWDDPPTKKPHSFTHKVSFGTAFPFSVLYGRAHYSSGRTHGAWPSNLLAKYKSVFFGPIHSGQDKIPLFDLGRMRSPILSQNVGR